MKTLNNKQPLKHHNFDMLDLQQIEQEKQRWLAIQEEGETVAAIKELMGKLDGLASAAGGHDRLKAVVDFWAEVEG